MPDFKDLLKNAGTLAFLKESGISVPTEAQVQALTPLAEGRPVSLLSQTGSGKTLAYALPLVERLKELEAKEGPNREPGAPRLVVLAPTRELANQIMGVIKGLAHHLKFRVRLLDAGDKGRSKMAAGPVDVLVAVPGKLVGCLKRKELSLAHIKALVLDEADQLLDAGFKKELENIFQSCPRTPEGRPLTQVVLVSATMPPGSMELRAKLFKSVPFLDLHLTQAHHVPHFVETFNIYLAPKEKIAMAREFLAREADGEGIIFMNKKEEVDAVCKELQDLLPNKKLIALHGGMTPQDRRRAYQQFKKGGVVLVATDIAARGIDIQGLSWVLNYDLPFEAVYYIHRAGRAGRGAEQGGKVYNMVTSKDTNLIARINESIRGQTALKLLAIHDRFDIARKTNTKNATRQAEDRQRGQQNKSEERAERKAQKSGKSRKGIKASKASRAQPVVVAPTPAPRGGPVKKKAIRRVKRTPGNQRKTK